MNGQEQKNAEWMIGFFYRTLAKAWFHIYEASRSLDRANGVKEKKERAVYIGFGTLDYKNAEQYLKSAKTLFNGELIQGLDKEQRTEIEGDLHQLSQTFRSLQERRKGMVEDVYKG